MTRWGVPVDCAILVALCVPALRLLARDGLPATHDGHLHLLRLVQLASLRGDGVWFTRWLPDAAYGFGMPVFAYYAPLAYAGSVKLELLGVPILAAYKLSTALYVVLAAVGMYFLCRGPFGWSGAIAAAVAYAYAPYMLTNVYVRGAYAEVAVAAWLPLGVLSVMRLASAPSRWWLAATAVSTAGLVLTHNVTALLFLPALAALATVLAWRDPRALGRCSAGLALGLAMATWFWLPALAERAEVSIEALIEPELFASFFIREWPITQASLAVDYRSPVSEVSGWPIYWPRVGLVQAGLGVAGAIAALTLVDRRLAAWAVGLAAVCLVAQLGPARPVFELVPLLSFVQFPWRLLLPLSLATAILAAVLVGALGRFRLGSVAAMIVVATVVIWSSTAALDPEWEFPRDEFLSVDALAALDLGGVGVGTTHGGEYLPRTSGMRNANRFWKELREADSGSPRGDRSSVTIHAVSWRANSIALEYSAERQEPLILRLFWFPGWRAWIDGIEAPTRPGGRFGQLALDALPGRHQLEVRFDWTPLRLGALVASIVALGATLAMLMSPRLLVAMALAVATACAPGGSTRIASAMQPIRVTDDLTLLDATIEASGGGTILRTVWHSSRRGPAPAELQLSAGQQDAATQGRQAGWLMRTWDRNEIATTTQRLVTPPAVRPGDVEVSVGRAVRVRPRVVGEPRRDQVDRSPVAVELDATLAAPTGVSAFGPVARGEPLDVDVRVTGTRSEGRDIRLALAIGGAPAVGTLPTSLGGWYLAATRRTRMDVVRQRLRLFVPESLPTGQHPLALLASHAELPWAGIAPLASVSLERAPRWESEWPLGTVSVR